MPKWFYALLIFAVAAPLVEMLHVPPLLLFCIAGLGIVPLASLIGQSVEEIAEYTGEQIGGLLFATFGNITELIIGIFALTQGLVSVVTASIIGSVLGNALLVLGVSVLVGGIKNGRLKFEVRPASQYASLLALCIGGLLLPTIAELLASRANQGQVIERGVLLSDFIAVLLLLGYVASVLFSVFHLGDRRGEGKEGEEEALEPLLGARSSTALLRLLDYRHHLAASAASGSGPSKSGMLRQIDQTIEAIKEHEHIEHAEHTPPDTRKEDVQKSQSPARQPAVPAAKEKQPSSSRETRPPLWRAILFLTIATAGVAVLSEILVSSIEPVTVALHWNPAFVGLIFIPLIGSLPEYFNTISMALEKRVGMVLAASAGSSIQIALLVAPILVLVSLFTPKRLDLIFSIVELGVLGLATFLFSEITQDGELVWLEGLLLILLYAMMGGTVFIFGS